MEDSKISASGEELALIYIAPNDTVILDYISFGEQTSTMTYGQYGDGMGNWQQMEPTPNATNLGVPTSIDIGESDYSIKIYPNPTNENIHIVIDDSLYKSLSNTAQISIKDIMGRIVLSPFQINQKTNTIDISDLPQGNYFLTVVVGNYQIIKRVIKI